MASTKSKILVVDDELEIVSSICELLQYHGYETVTAHDGTEAVEKAIRHQPQLILLDIQMPDSLSVSVLNRLKSTSETAHIPVLIISGLVASSIRNAVMEAGAAGFIAKPFSSQNLLRQIHEMAKKAPKKIAGHMR